MAISFKRILTKIFNKPYTLIPLYLYTLIVVTFFLTPNIHAQEQSEVFLKGAAVTDIAEEEGFLWVATYGQGIKSRQQPVLNLDLGHHVSTVAHLGNIAYRTARKVSWDAVKERMAGDIEADKQVGVSYRKPWKLPYARRA